MGCLRDFLFLFFCLSHEPGKKRTAFKFVARPSRQRRTGLGLPNFMFCPSGLYLKKTERRSALTHTNPKLGKKRHDFFRLSLITIA